MCRSAHQKTNNLYVYWSKLKPTLCGTFYAINWLYGYFLLEVHTVIVLLSFFNKKKTNSTHTRHNLTKVVFITVRRVFKMLNTCRSSFRLPNLIRFSTGVPFVSIGIRQNPRYEYRSHLFIFGSNTWIPVHSVTSMSVRFEKNDRFKTVWKG